MRRPILLLLLCLCIRASAASPPKPLFADPHYHGSCDRDAVVTLPPGP